MIQIKSTAFKETALLVLVLFLSGCATTSQTMVKKTAPQADAPERKVCSSQKGTVFLIASSSLTGRLLTTHQPRFFHEPSGKPASPSEASQGCHHRDTSCASRAMADVMQLQNLTA